MPVYQFVEESTKMSAKKKEGDVGKQYERKMLTLVALKCLLTDNIKDFWIVSNHVDIEKFDDIILYVEYEDNRKELFFMQLKHKQKSGKPIVVEMFRNSQKDFALKIYQEAYEAILNKKEEFFTSNEIPEETELFFILHNNCKVSMKSDDPNVCFELVEREDFRSFVSSKSSEIVSTEFKIKDPEFQAEFLNKFYFYADQLKSDDVENEIANYIGLNSEIVNNMLKYFYDYSDSKNTVKKLHKLDIKTKLLGCIFGDFLPPTQSLGNHSILDVIHEFTATIITEEYSEIFIWSNILEEMKKYYQQNSLELNHWEKPLSLSKELQDHLRNALNLADGDQINTKHLYLHMVAKGELPFYIKTDNRSFDVFFNKLLIKLGVTSVIFDSKKVFAEDVHSRNIEGIDENLNVENIFSMSSSNANSNMDGVLDETRKIPQVSDAKIFKSMKDLDGRQFLDLANRIKISFQGKEAVALSNILDSKRDVKATISTDILISLLDQKLELGSSMQKAEIYIDRKLKLPLVDESILENGLYLFIVCGISSLNDFECFSLDGKGDIDITGKLEETIEDMDYPESFPIFNTMNVYDDQLMNSLKIPHDQLYCILQFVRKNKEMQNRFIVIDTNGPLDILKSGMCDNEYHAVKDEELLGRNSKINIICNNAGMGKSMLLKHVSHKFSPSNWVIHLELGKFFTSIEKIKDFDEFIQFLCQIEMEAVDERYRIFFKFLFHHSVSHNKMILLIDDYEEINKRKLLAIFKECVNEGIIVWIAGRQYLKTELEEAFQVFSIELEEFSNEDQNDFFKAYFAHKKDVEKELTLINKTRAKLEGSFIGICQQTMMLAKVLLDSNDEISEDHIRIDDLYERFINIEISQHHLKSKRFILRVLSKLALYSFFSETVLRKLFDWDELECDIEVFKEENPKATLVIEFMKNNIPVFSHKTYAEFLAARWLAETAKKQIEGKTPFDIRKVLELLLYCQELTNVRLFFDKIITRGKLIHSTIVNYDELTTKSLCNLDEIDILGRTGYHMFMSYGTRYEIHTDLEVKQALQNVDERSNFQREKHLIFLKIPNMPIKFKPNMLRKNTSLNISSEILKKDSLLKKDAIDYAFMSGSLEELELVLDTDSFIKSSSNLLSNVNFETLCFTLLHCIKNNLSKIFSKILTHDSIARELTKIRESSTKMSLLHIAVKYSNPKAVQRLIKIYPIKTWGVDKEKNTPLHLACEERNSKILEMFFRLDKYTTSFLNMKNNRGWSHLHYFAYHGDDKWVEKLMNYHVEINAKCNKGNTPFILSIMKKKLAVAEALKIRGAKIDIGNNKKMTALHFSAARGMYKCTECLIKMKAQLDVKTSNGATPLIKAASWGHVKIVELLLQSGARIDAVDLNKWTALHHAVKRKKYNVIQTLLRKGAKTEVITNKGHTPLIIACLGNDERATKILLNHSHSKGYNNISAREIAAALHIARRMKFEGCFNRLNEFAKRKKIIISVIRPRRTRRRESATNFLKKLKRKFLENYGKNQKQTSVE